jgi:hypothetical protein
MRRPSVSPTGLLLQLRCLFLALPRHLQQTLARQTVGYAVCKASAALGRFEQLVDGVVSGRLVGHVAPLMLGQDAVRTDLLTDGAKAADQ